MSVADYQAALAMREEAQAGMRGSRRWPMR